ncbi:MAG: aminotransferase class V-fold PLP-dependent enzyme [Anaerolineaceae bacterium]|nr:aminotransferase class V-fold PLP-dependent enzyme [Anaerolineaceae bacterium]
MLQSIPSTQSLTEQLRKEIVGIDQQVPLLDGSFTTYTNLDNSASTPALLRVQEKTDEMFSWYSSVHRGSGFKSLLSTHLYDEAREVVLNFVGADPESECVIFCKNTTEAINQLASIFPFEPGDMVLTTGMEHHSDDLPWRANADVIYANVLDDGALDLEDFAAKLERNAGRIKLVAVTGASNVSGFIPPIYEIAEMAHKHGAKILADCAQLFPHRKINVGPADSPRHLDFIAFSAHKVYAPLGSGGLIGSKEFFNQLDPVTRGGGTVEIVTLNEVIWTSSPERDEAGSPNVIGAVALAVALKRLSEIGMDAIEAHEAELTHYALSKLKQLDGITLYGLTDPNRLTDRLGVIPFQVNGLTHGKAAAILGFEGGIGVRNGCFCAHPYILRLLHVTDEEYKAHHDRVVDHNRADLPGLIRISFGCYNNFEDIDRLVNMLERITKGDYQGEYAADNHSGSYYPQGFEMVSLSKYFSF